MGASVRAHGKDGGWVAKPKPVSILKLPRNSACCRPDRPAIRRRRRHGRQGNFGRCGGSFSASRPPPRPRRGLSCCAGRLFGPSPTGRQGHALVECQTSTGRDDIGSKRFRTRGSETTHGGALALPLYGQPRHQAVRSLAFSRDFLPHLRGRLVRSEPDIDRLPQKPVGGPGQ